MKAYLSCYVLSEHLKCCREILNRQSSDKKIVFDLRFYKYSIILPRPKNEKRAQRRMNTSMNVFSFAYYFSFYFYFSHKVERALVCIE